MNCGYYGQLVCGRNGGESIDQTVGIFFNAGCRGNLRIADRDHLAFIFLGSV